ncbi:hypothetical protein XBI1_2960054 [Xenorhabdus bovienii str. Intermedium]|uniref:Uncharacterized protein n=1 Tax=Xenorhabdus bovienii str. Intermedium TaxID=1379677 RepID=A0A077QDM7_XENBV|nr:hypothetical protein XBI1_2960054 [Xenorhabdus bovienii str. Intermedium]
MQKFLVHVLTFPFGVLLQQKTPTSIYSLNTNTFVGELQHAFGCI